MSSDGTDNIDSIVMDTCTSEFDGGTSSNNWNAGAGADDDDDDADEVDFEGGMESSTTKVSGRWRCGCCDNGNDAIVDGDDE